MNNNDIQIVPGISISKTGKATIDSSLADVLFDLAMKLEELTALPVDVQHVVAALVLSVRNGQIDPGTPITSDDPALTAVLTTQLQTVFAVDGGNVGSDN